MDVVGFMQILWKYIKSLDSRISPLLLTLYSYKKNENISFFCRMASVIITCYYNIRGNFHVLLFNLYRYLSPFSMMDKLDT